MPPRKKRDNRMRFESGELMGIVHDVVIREPGLYGAEITDRIFSERWGSDGYANQMCVLASIKHLEKRGRVRRVEDFIQTRMGRRLIKRVYPLEIAA